MQYKFQRVQTVFRSAIMPLSWAVLFYLVRPALFAQTNHWYVTTLSNLRAGPDTTFAVIAKLPRNTPVTYLDRKGEWLQVQRADGQTGWILQKLAKPVTDETTPTKTVARTSDQEIYDEIQVLKNGNLYAGPSTGDNILRTLPAGMVVKKIDAIKEWYRVRLPDGTLGWVHQNLFIITKKSPAAHPPVTTTKNGFLRRRPEPDAEIITTIPAGSILTILDTAKDWYQVQNLRGDMGWVNRVLFQDDKLPAAKVEIRRPLLKNGNLRAEPLPSGKIITVVPAHSVVWVVDSTSEWYQVRTTGRLTGWLNKALFAALQGSATPAKAALIVARNGNLRRQPDLNAEIIDKIPINTTVAVLEEQLDWYQVRTTNGLTGWAHKIIFESQSPRQNERPLTTLILPVNTILRIRPSESDSVVAVLQSGQRLTIVDSVRGWYYVQGDNHSKGWIFKPALQESYSPPVHAPKNGN